MKTLILVVLVVIQTTWAVAQPIYRNTNESGTVTYSSKPMSKTSAPAKLPPIIRDRSLRPSPAVSPKSIAVTCSAHGGINCASGPDSDGSVICNDGSKDSQERFNFTCRAPRLLVDAIVGNGEGGGAVLVRNTGAVVAREVKVYVAHEPRGRFQLQGPTEIAQYESGEFRYDATDSSRLGHEPKESDIIVSCSTCSS